MKKAQLAGLPLMHILFALIAVFILIFGAVQITRWAARSGDLELSNFLSSLQNTVEKHSLSSHGSVDEKVIAVPAGIESVCFVDRNKTISPLINCNLNDEINKYENKNVFFEPFGKFNPIWMDGFELREDENPLCLKTVEATLKTSLTSKGGKSLISTFRDSEKEIDCVSLLYNSPPNNSIDIAFLGYGYDKYDSFRKDANDNIEVFLETEPFKSYQEGINFYQVNKLGGFDCEVGNWVRCDEFSVKKMASYCPNDYIFILVDRSRIKDFIKPVRSSAVSNMEKINTADNKLVVLHEFGHIFGGLADEYVDEKYYSNIGFDPESYPNCDLPPECDEWKDVNGTGCFEGCSLNRYSRPTTNSIMRTLSTEKFGPLNERIIIDKLDLYKEGEE
ncbi:M64 family metallopeptidase [Candidatus Woesearchaeota archaeon]|nr:M64 family metallopeptidase [Candidatus Woesearchaeota archaeon]